MEIHEHQLVFQVVCFFDLGQNQLMVNFWFGDWWFWDSRVAPK